MPEHNSVTVRVPATTANLGPGFDSLGLALDIWNEVCISVSGSSLKIDVEGEGLGLLPTDTSNLIYRCMLALADKASLKLPDGLHIHCINSIPVSSGLGSSSAAVVAGLLSARSLLSINISDNELLKIALAYEGHSDNIAACLFGGLTISVIEDSEMVVKKISIQPINAVIALPEVSLSTHQARAALPDTVQMKAAVFNIGRAALLVNALQEPDYGHLKIAMRDALHQPYRLKLVPGADQAIAAALEAGALGAALSGAGPSIFAFVEGENPKIGDVIAKTFARANLSVRIISTSSTNVSASVRSDNSR